MKRIYNFSAGPAILPLPVIQEASQAVQEIDLSGMSILEVSHRGKHYERIHADTKARLFKVSGLNPTEYTAMFLGGGASMQFGMLPMNFLSPNDTVDYVHTGEWSSKAIKEAKRYGKVNLVASSEAEKFASLPKSITATPGAKYLHYTTNNTIEGTEFGVIPEVGETPLAADMSSDIFSRSLDFKKFSFIYAGAQKNAGPAGVTIVLVKNTFLEQAQEDLPSMLSYKIHAKNDSLYNTPPAFSIYVVGLVLKWIESQGGLRQIETLNRRKAEKVYAALDAFPDVYDVVVKNKAERSLMNLTFRLKNGDKEKEFLAGAEKREMDGLKGHRSVGGFRASIYNAFPEEGCDRLAEYITEFAKA